MIIEKKHTADLLPADYNPRKALKPGDLEYEKLKRYVKNAVTKIGQEIISGNIEIKPVRDGGFSPCSYCRYRVVCGFDPEIHPCRYARSFSSDEEIWNEM